METYKLGLYFGRSDERYKTHNLIIYVDRKIRASSGEKYLTYTVWDYMGNYKYTVPDITLSQICFGPRLTPPSVPNTEIDFGKEW